MIQFRFVTIGKLSNEFLRYVQSTYPEFEINLASDKNELLRLLPNANAYAGFCELEDTDVSHLKWIHSFGAGVDLFLENKSIVGNRVPISRTSGELGRQMGEYCLAHILNWYQEIEAFQVAQKAKSWKQLSTRKLFESNVLILGTGNIGTKIAKVIRPLVSSVTGVNAKGKELHGFDYGIMLNKIDFNFDIIINALPNTGQTKGILNGAFFEKFKDAFFINVGRGSAVVNADLIQSLDKGYLSAAVLDVFEKEPLDIESELWSHPKITVTPHISGTTTIDDVISSFADAYEHMKNSTQGESFVKYDKGY